MVDMADMEEEGVENGEEVEEDASAGEATRRGNGDGVNGGDGMRKKTSELCETCIEFYDTLKDYQLMMILSLWDATYGSLHSGNGTSHA